MSEGPLARRRETVVRGLATGGARLCATSLVKPLKPLEAVPKARA